MRSEWDDEAAIRRTPLVWTMWLDVGIEPHFALLGACYCTGEEMPTGSGLRAMNN